MQMNKTLLISGMTLTLIAGHAYASVEKPSSGVRAAISKATRYNAAMKDEAVARFFHPRTVSSQFYDSDGGAWGEVVNQKFTYNTDGTVASEEFEGGMTKFSYNENGNLIRKEVFTDADGTMKLSSVSEYTYDTIVKDLVTSTTDTNYNPYGESADEPENVYAYGIDITRNTDGNITKVASYTIWGDEKNYNESLEIEYGADRKAIKITEIGNIMDDNGNLAPGVYRQLTDITWASTDGQIVTFEYDDPNGEMYFSKNRIASATIIDDDYPRPATLKVTYDGDSYHSLLTMGTERLMEIDFKCLEIFPVREDFNEYCSYDCTSFEVDYDYDDEEDVHYIDYSRTRTEQNRADAFGHNLLYKSTTAYEYSDPSENETEVNETKTEVTYDSAIGYPLTATLFAPSYETGELSEYKRITYTDYVNVDPAGVEGPVVDTDAAPEYYTLQGVRVANPSTGLYIVRQGSLVRKVCIR